MAFTVPNYDAATWAAQARLFSTDLAILGASAGGYNGVLSGCLAAPKSPVAMLVNVSSGYVLLANSSVTVAGNDVTIDTNPGANPRIDLIVVGASGTAYVVKGTAAVSPQPPAVPASTVCLAFVYVPPACEAVAATQIVDKRITVPSPLGESQWTTLSKAASQSKTSDISPADDDTLKFTMLANTKYRIRATVFVQTASSAPGCRIRTAGPASPTLVSTHWKVPNPSTGFDSIGRMEQVYSATDFQISFTSAYVLPVYINSVVHNGANSGTWSLQWAQLASSASATTWLAGSYLEYEVA